VSDRVLQLLDALSAAVSEGAFDEAQAVAAELQTEYANRREDEVGRATRARALLSSAEPHSAADATALSDAIQVGGGTRVTRSIVLLTVSALAGSHESLRANGQLEETVATAEAAIEELALAEQAAESASADADEVIGASTVPPTIAIRGVSVGDVDTASGTVSVSTTLTNTGDRTATGVTLSFQPPDGVTAAEDRLRLGSLEPDQSETVGTTASARTGGVYAVGVRAAGENVTAAHRTVTVTIPDPDDSDGPFAPPDSDSQTPENPLGPPGLDSQTPENPFDPPDSDSQTPENPIGPPGLGSQTPDGVTTTPGPDPTPFPSEETTVTVTETATETADSASEPSARNRPGDGAASTAGGGSPGFGVVGTLAGLGYLAYRGLSSEPDSDE
jgi:hypothetical protein